MAKYILEYSYITKTIFEPIKDKNCLKNNLLLQINLLTLPIIRHKKISRSYYQI